MPPSYAPSHLAKLQPHSKTQPHPKQPQSILDGCTSKSRHDGKRRTLNHQGSLQELGLAVISRQNGGAPAPREKLKQNLTRDLRKDSYRSYEKEKEEKTKISSELCNSGMRLIDVNIKKNQNLEEFQCEGEHRRSSGLAEDDDERSSGFSSLPNKAKRRNLSPVLNGLERSGSDERETLLRSSKDFNDESIKESEV